MLAIVLMMCTWPALGAAGAAARPWQLIVSGDILPDNQATPIDTATDTAGAAFFGGQQPTGVTISPDGLTAYIANIGGAQRGFTPVDLSGATPVTGATVTTSSAIYPLQAAVTPDGRTLWMAVNGGQLVKTDLTTQPLTISAPISDGTSDGAQHIAISPDGRSAYVSDRQAGQVSVVDLASGGHATPIAVGTTPASPGPGCPSAASSCPYGIAITPDGRTLVVADIDSRQVSFVDLANGSHVTNVATPDGQPLQTVTISPDGAIAYVAVNAIGGGADEVLPIDIATQTRRTPIPVQFSDDPTRGQIWPMAITPDGRKLYVGDGFTQLGGGGGGPFRSDQVIAIPVKDGAADGAQTTITTNPNEPWGMAVTPDQAPHADFTVSGAPSGSATSFDATCGATPSCSTIRFGAIASYRWDFGDGSAPITTTTPTTTHVYAGGGSYQATLTETSSAGTSTGPTVYTGQTAVKVGSPLAAVTRSVVVTSGPVPSVSLSTSALAFGAVGVGRASAPQTVTVRNNGTAPLTVSGSSVGGDGARDYAISADGCAGQAIAPGGSCTATLTFTPTAAGERDARLAFADDASGSPHGVALTGSGATIGTLAGTVSNGDSGAPLAGATVRACVPPGFNDCRQVTTSADGTYAIASLPSGTRDVEVFPASGSLSGASATVTIVPGTVTEDFQLSAPDPISGGSSFLTPGGRLTDGVPVVNWNEPFGFDVPVDIPASSDPGSLLLLPVTGHIGLDPGDGTDGGFSLDAYDMLAVSYDSAGHPAGIAGVENPATGGSASASASAVAHAAKGGGSSDTIGTIQNIIGSLPKLNYDPNGDAYYSFTIPLEWGASLDVRVRQHQFSTGKVQVLTEYTVHAPHYDGPCPPEAYKAYVRLFDSIITSLENRISAGLGAASRGIFDGGSDLANAVGKAIHDGLADAVQNLTGVPVPRAALRSVAPGAAAAASGPAPQMSAQILVGGTPVQLAKATDGVVALRGAAVTVSFQVPPLGQRVHGAFSWSYETPRVSLTAHSGTPPAASARVRAHAADGESCDAKPKPKPPKPKPPSGGGGGGYIDPSGIVVSTTGVPLLDARVTLLRGDSTSARLVAVPNGSAVMSPANRRNPGRTDALGAFGWDVLAGFYQVTATHAGCSAGKTKVLKIPPPVTDLRLKLRCKHLASRVAAKVGLRVVRRTKGELLVARVTTARGGRPVGTVRFRAGGHTLGNAVVNPRSRLATLVLTARPKAHPTARYLGDARHAAARSR